jgi:hypothetical protein
MWRSAKSVMWVATSEFVVFDLDGWLMADRPTPGPPGSQPTPSSYRPSTCWETSDPATRQRSSTTSTRCPFPRKWIALCRRRTHSKPE